jgi:hypothetical protein
MLVPANGVAQCFPSDCALGVHGVAIRRGRASPRHHLAELSQQQTAIRHEAKQLVVDFHRFTQ